MIVSRIANAKLRQELEFDDFWEHNMDYEDEVQALDDFAYLTQYKGVREYMLARMKIDPLNDPLPL